MRPAARRIRNVVMAALVAVVAVAAVTACASRPPVQWDGLELRPSRTLNHVWVRPGVEFREYRRVRLDPASVAFDKAWDPVRIGQDLARRITPEDVRDIKDGLATMLARTFAAELTRGGYALADADGPDVLRVTPAIVDLYVNAPDVPTAGRSRTYVMDAGRMTLVVEARDSVSGQLLARAVDTRHGTETGRLQRANAVTNSQEAGRAIEQWARALREGLDRLRAAPVTR